MTFYCKLGFGLKFKTTKNFIIVAPIELKFGPRARFRVSGLLVPFSDHSEQFFHCELDLDDLDLCNASSYSNSETTFTLGTPPWRLAKVVSELGLVAI